RQCGDGSGRNREQGGRDDGALSSPALRESAEDDAAADGTEREHDSHKADDMRVQVVIALKKERMEVLAAMAERVEAGHEQNQKEEQWPIAPDALPQSGK